MPLKVVKMSHYYVILLLYVRMWNASVIILIVFKTSTTLRDLLQDANTPWRTERAWSATHVLWTWLGSYACVKWDSSWGQVLQTQNSTETSKHQCHVVTCGTRTYVRTMACIGVRHQLLNMQWTGATEGQGGTAHLEVELCDYPTDSHSWWQLVTEQALQAQLLSK